MTLTGGEVITDDLPVADAHPLGTRPFGRDQYLRKFTELADGIVEPVEQQRFLSAADGLADLKSGALDALHVSVDPRVLETAPVIGPGIFGDRPP